MTNDRRRHVAQELRRIAQNDYMINQHFLPDGELLNEAAAEIDPEGKHECNDTCCFQGCPVPR